MNRYETSKPTSTVTHFLQKGYAFSDKATPPNSATFYTPRMQTHESMGTTAVQVTIVRVRKRLSLVKYKESRVMLKL